MTYSPLINQLIDDLRGLPGIGPKAAQRIAFYLLQYGKANGLALAKALEQAINQVDCCQQCRMLTESSLCNICSNPGRDSSTLCIVESPVDVISIENTNNYKGLYFVLMGHLSPLDGIGPDELGIGSLTKLLDKIPFKEVIIATNPTVEGEATAHYLSNFIGSRQIKCTRIAHGIPVGGELEYTNIYTLIRALEGRLEIGEAV